MWDLFNKKKISELERKVKYLDDESVVYRERNAQLEEELRLSLDLKLKYEVARMLIDDDPMVDEMIGYATQVLAHGKPQGGYHRNGAANSAGLGGTVQLGRHGRLV